MERGGIYAFTLGGFFELPLGKRWPIDVGVGAVAAAAHRHYSFSESTTITAPVGFPECGGAGCSLYGSSNNILLATAGERDVALACRRSPN